MIPFPSPPKGMRIPCRDNPERQFPNQKDAAQVEAAKTVCRTGDSGRRCPFFDDCLHIALAFAVDGVWAATTPDERQAIRERTGVVPLPVVVSPYSVRAYQQRMNGAA